jgi:hypothetical protein
MSKLRIQSRHSTAEHPLDAYMSPPCAVEALIAVEAGHIPPLVWEPCSGDHTGQADPLRRAGYHVITSDIADYGVPHDDPALILKGEVPAGWDTSKARFGGRGGIVTNPPYMLAPQFIARALEITSYSAWLLRTNFLESTTRLPFFRAHPPARLWVSSRRLPMMHRYGWTGPKAPSNTAFCWMIWDQAYSGPTVVDWFDWRNHASGPIDESEDEGEDFIGIAA